MTRTMTATEAAGSIDSAFTIHPDGTITDGYPDGIYAPEVIEYCDTDGQSLGEPDVWPGWELLTGYTGQCGYRGATMHSSEYVDTDCRLWRDMVESATESGESQTYAFVTVTFICDNDTDDGPCSDCESGLAWAIAHKCAVTA